MRARASRAFKAVPKQLPTPLAFQRLPDSDPMIINRYRERTLKSCNESKLDVLFLKRFAFSGFFYASPYSFVLAFYQEKFEALEISNT